MNRIELAAQLFVQLANTCHCGCDFAKCTDLADHAFCMADAFLAKADAEASVPAVETSDVSTSYGDQ